MAMQELIAVRVKDGIFVGNVIAAQDREFLSMNKITHLINCAGGEVPDLFMDDGIKYLTFPWKDTTGAVCTAVMFDSADENIKRTVQFIDEALEAGDCVLVHSCYGTSRSPALVAAYFIVKYGWKLDSALSYLEMAHKDMSIKSHFLRQLRMFARRNSVDYDVFDLEVDDSPFGLDNDQWMLRNTLLNGLSCNVQLDNELYKQCTSKVDIGQIIKVLDLRVLARTKHTRRIVFIDTKQGTHVDSQTGTPVVTAEPILHIDPCSTAHFIGSQGPIALRAGRRRNSIMRRSISPCNRLVESNPRTNPRGRQELFLRESDTKGRSSSIQDGVSSQAVRTSSGHSMLSGSFGGTENRRVPLPNTVHAPIRSPFAVLSTHKYRNGSPLPMATNGNKLSTSSRIAQRPSSAHAADTPRTRSPLGSNSCANGGANSGSSRLSRSSARRTSSPVPLSSAMSSSPAATPASRVSRYKNIAPQRAQVGGNIQPAWNSSKGSIVPPTNVYRSSVRSNSHGSRPSSPVSRPVSASRRVASPNGDVNRDSVNGSSFSVGLLRRQPPAIITSGRSA